jgi:hypothetical protein
VFVRQKAQHNDLPLPEDMVESVIEIAYFKWKAIVT